MVTNNTVNNDGSEELKSVTITKQTLDEKPTEQDLILLGNKQKFIKQADKMMLVYNRHVKEMSHMPLKIVTIVGLCVAASFSFSYFMPLIIPDTEFNNFLSQFLIPLLLILCPLRWLMLHPDHQAKKVMAEINDIWGGSSHNVFSYQKPNNALVKLDRTQIEVAGLIKNMKEDIEVYAYPEGYYVPESHSDEVISPHIFVEYEDELYAVGFIESNPSKYRFIKLEDQ